MQAAMQPLLQEEGPDDTARCVALVAGDGSAASLQFARSIASQQHWDAAYSMLADVLPQHISPKACCSCSQTTRGVHDLPLTAGMLSDDQRTLRC